MLESPNQRRIWVAAAALVGVILFRVNTGKAWVPTSGKPRRLPDGMFIPGGRPIALGFGLLNGEPAVGVADLCGWRSILVTPDMVGCRIAVFASIEAKRSDGGRVSEEQARWRDTIIAAGGIAGVANSAEEAIAIFNSWHPFRPASR